MQHLHGPRIKKGKEIIVICVFRNGQLYLPHFLEHHRKLGVDHFFFLDNASDDGSGELIKSQNDTTLYRCNLPFRKYKSCYKRFLIERHARDCWTLLLDIDECFDYPRSEEIQLPQFVEYLEQRGCNAAIGHMLDLFSDQAILHDVDDSEKDLSSKYRFFDLSGLVEEEYSVQFGKTNKLTDPEIKTLYGGVRHSAFGNHDLLTKHPLFRMHAGMGPTNSAHDITYSTIADVTAVLYHFKFTSDFRKVLKRALKEKGYYNDSLAYKNMASRLRKEPELTLMSQDTRKLENADQLLHVGFLRASTQYLDWVASKNPHPEAPNKHEIEGHKYQQRVAKVPQLANTLGES